MTGCCVNIETFDIHPLSKDRVRHVKFGGLFALQPKQIDVSSSPCGHPNTDKNKNAGLDFYSDNLFENKRSRWLRTINFFYRCCISSIQKIPFYPPFLMTHFKGSSPNSKEKFFCGLKRIFSDTHRSMFQGKQPPFRHPLRSWDLQCDKPTFSSPRLVRFEPSRHENTVLF